VTHSQTIEERIREFVQRTFPLARKKNVHENDKWLEAGILDSLGILDLVHFLEQEFSIQISDEELDPANFESLGAVASFARKKALLHQDECKPCN